MMYFSKYTFHCSLDQVWPWIITTTKFSELVSRINKKLSTEPLSLSRDKTYEVNSKFRCCYQDILNLDFTVDSIVKTDYYHMIKWKINLPFSSDDCQFKGLSVDIWLHYVSNCLTLFVAQLPLSEDNMIKLGMITRHESIYDYCQVIEKCLVNKNVFSMNCESRIIKAPLAECINYFENARICTSLVGKVVSSTNDEIKKGTIVINSMKEWATGKDEQLVMQVRKCLNKSNTFKSSFLIYKQNEASPLRSMDTELFQVNDNETLAVLRHHFFTVISEEGYNLISKEKKKFLKKIGCIIETLNKDVTAE